MTLNVYKIYVGAVFTLLLVLFSSCVDEISVDKNMKGAFISITGITPMAGTDLGSPEDYVVSSLRVLAFNRSTGACVSNIRYNEDEWMNNVLRYSIIVGNYDFVFLANEPAGITMMQTLNAVSVYGDLDNIAYPASAFTSNLNIPMIQEIKNVTILSNGAGITLNDGTTVSMLKLALDRMGVRIEATLEGEEDYDTVFSGVIFSNIPDLVPLTAGYSGSISRNTIRKFSLSENGSYFSNVTPGTSGMNWGKKISRVILPSSEPASKNDKTEAVVFTVNMGDNYNPSCELMIGSNPANYSLPGNTKLDLTGVIREPLVVNIEASPWGMEGEDWDLSGNRVLNVSQTEVYITDFNGARISFWSNMPVVRVLDNVASGGQTLVTNEVFNALSSHSSTPNSDERISYDPNTGAGYMDILLDLPNVVGEKTYELTLMAAEDYSGTNSIKKKITVHVKQEGERFAFVKNSAADPWSTPYIGAFFRNDEVGERVISGIRYNYWHSWEAEVPDEYKDFIVISSTPSFDPYIGTSTPGDPEDYPVVPNYQKKETGDFVSGRGRIYFRIGMKGKNTNTNQPKYGVVNLWYQASADVNDKVYTQIYVRQGEAADYLMRSGTSGSTFGQRFSPYNLTVSTFKNNPSTTARSYQMNYTNLATEVDFVDYPTQAGAHFQWGLPVANAATGRRAYHPTNANAGSTWNISGWPQNTMSSPPLWDPASGDKYKSYYEICPPGYYRPTDGPVNEIAVNSNNYTQVYKSEWRMSLFNTPMRGDAGTGTSQMPYDPTKTTEVYNAVILNEGMYGFYADGFFDRRPIVKRNMINGLYRDQGTVLTTYKGVSLDNTEAAYGGTLLFNTGSSKASIFFPAAGRRWYADGSLEYASETGYYWSSSVAPGWTYKVGGIEYGTPFGNIWTMEFNYPTTRPISMNHLFGYSIRCVKR